MRTIYKYPLQLCELQSVEMIEGAQILCLQIQNQNPCIWAYVDSEIKNTKDRIFITHGTGGPMGNESLDNYIGTYQINGGSLVFHVFEKTA